MKYIKHKQYEYNRKEMYIIRHILEINNIRKEEIMSNMFESLKEVFNKRWLIRSVSLGLSVVVLGGVLLRTPKSYGNDGIMSLGEFYELELNLDNNNSSGEDDIYNDSDSSYDYDYDYDYDNSDYDYDYNYDDDYNYDEYNYGDYDYDDYDYNDYSYSDYEDYFEDNDYDYDYDYGTNDYSYDSGYDDYFGGYNYSDYFGYEDVDWGFGYENEWGEEMKEEHVPGIDFLKTPKTLQYTLDTDSRNPIYTDTGIKFNEFIKSEDIKEFFRQISLKKDIKFIESVDSIMVLSGGKIEVFKGNLSETKTLIEFLDEIGIKVKLQDTRAGGKFNLADSLEHEKKLRVRVNNKDVKFIIDPKVENSRVLFPIRSIGEAMGLDVKWDNEKSIAKVSNDEREVIFTGNSDVVLIDGIEYLLSEKTHLNNEERRILSIINVLVKTFDGEMVWNTKDSVLEITMPDEELENIDKYL